MDAYFIFKNKSSKDYGILIETMPEITKPQRREQEITIPGRNGVLTIDEDAYEPYTLSFTCSTRDISRVNDIVAWLDGSGNLTVSTEPDKIYKAKISNAIPISGVVYLYPSFLVQFKVFPFKYSRNAVISHADDLTLTSPTTIRNSGTVYSQPTITVYGSGNITLTINGTNYGLTSVSGYITINSEMMEVYKDSTNANNKYSAMDFPRFEVGQNSISWTGSATKVEIEPKWRWL